MPEEKGILISKAIHSYKITQYTLNVYDGERLKIPAYHNNNLA